jgi:hypothetical protein
VKPAASTAAGAGVGVSARSAAAGTTAAAPVAKPVKPAQPKSWKKIAETNTIHEHDEH